MSVNCSQICLCAPRRGVRIVCQDQARDSSEISAPPVFGTPVPEDTFLVLPRLEVRVKMGCDASRLVTDLLLSSVALQRHS